mgnify:FL=1
MTLLFLFIGALILMIQLYYMMVMSGTTFKMITEACKKDPFIIVYYSILLPVGTVFYGLLIQALYNHK